MSGLDWGGFALAVLLIELTPGPNMAWLAGLSMSEGRRAGIAATIGIAIGLFFNALAAAMGLAAIVAASPTLWQLLRWAGVAFLLWLAWDSWRGADQAITTEAPLRSRRHFLAGLAVNLLNPKALLFFVVVIPQFSGGQLPTLAQAMALAGISIVIATAIHLIIVLAGAGLHRWLADAGKTRRVRRVLAVTLVGVAIWFAFGATMPGAT